MSIHGHQVNDLSHGRLLFRRVRHSQRFPVDGAGESGSYPQPHEVHPHEVMREQHGLHGRAG